MQISQTAAADDTGCQRLLTHAKYTDFAINAADGGLAAYLAKNCAAACGLGASPDDAGLKPPVDPPPTTDHAPTTQNDRGCTVHASQNGMHDARPRSPLALASALVALAMWRCKRRNT